MAGESLITTLGFDAQQAIATLKQLELSLNQYTVAMGRAARVTKKFNQSAMGIDRQIKKTDNVIRGFAAGVKKQETALKSADKQTKKVTKTLDDLNKQNKKTGAQMILTWQSVIRIFTIQVIHQMISKVTSALSQATGKAIDLEISLAEIQTIGGPLRDDFKGLADNVRNLSDEFGISADIVAEGIYQTLSNQVTEARNSFLFFSAAADFSVAAVTSADASVNLLSSTINAFGYNASQATIVGAKLFKAIELGRIRGEEFANTFGRVAVLASKLGIVLDEVLASITTLTIAGLKYNEAFTLINNVMLKLIRPTDALKEAFSVMGVESAEAGIQAYGFQGFLEKLSDSVGGTATEVGKLWGRVRAVRGALGLTGEAAKKYAKDLEAIRAVSPETLFEAKELIFETNAKQVQIEIEELRNAIVFDFGRPMLKVINNLIQSFGGLVNIVKSLATGAAFAGIGFAGLMVALHPIGATIIGIGAAVAALTILWGKYTQTQAEALKETIRIQKQAIIEINAAEAEAAELRILNIHNEFSELQKVLVEKLAAHKKYEQRAMQIEEIISDHFEQQLSDRKTAFNNFVKAISKSMDQAKDNINKAQKSIFSLQRSLAEETFESQISRIEDEGRQAQFMIKQATDIKGQAIRAARAGEEERAKILFGESNTLLQQAKVIGQNTNNVGLENTARKLITETIQTQIKLQKGTINREQQRTKELKQQLPVEKARARRISAIIDKLKEFELFDVKGKQIYSTAEEAAIAVKPLLDALNRELEGAGSKVNIFKGLEETGKTNIQDALKAALGPVEDIFSEEKIQLEFAYAKRIREVFKDINEIAKTLPIEVQFKLKELGFDPMTLKGIREASKGLPEMEKSLGRTVRSTSELKGLNKGLQEQLESVEDAAEAITDAFIGQLGVTKTINEAQIKLSDEVNERMEDSWWWWEGILSYRRKERDQMTDAEKLLGDQARSYETIGEAAHIAAEQIKGTFDIQLFQSAIKVLSEAALAQEALGRPEIAEAIRLQIKLLKDTALTAQHVQATVSDEATLKKIEESSKVQKESIKGIGTATQTAAMSSQTAFNAMISDMDRVQMAARQTAQAIAGIVGGAASASVARFGKMIYRQYGGYTPQSTDTIPAMLSPGEFVINAKSAKRFHSQLIAMNAGVQPAFRRMGGSTTTIGDINITVQGASSPKQTTREVMLAFRREKRRHTSRET